MEDGSCPCDKDPDCKGGCSGGKINDYTSEQLCMKSVAGVCV